MLVLLFWVALTSAELLKLDFTSTTATNNAVTKKRDLDLLLGNDLMHQRYVVNLTVGTPPQQFSLTLDTGSTDLWVPSPNSSGCLPNPCPPGTFDPASSSTSRATGFIFNATFGLTPDLKVVGSYFNDTVKIGCAIGVGNVPETLFDDGIFGIVGLGSRFGEAIFGNPSSPQFRDPNATFPTIYDQLQLHGYTNRRLFSIWLNEQSAATGSILFGGVDTTKFYGRLQSIPVILSGPSRIFTSWAVNLTSVIHVNSSSGGTQAFTPDDFAVTTILDSGSPNMYLPSSLAESIASKMGVSMYQGFPYVQCYLRQANELLEFGFGKSPGRPRIAVPYSELIYPYGFPANLGNVTAGDGSPLCYLGLIGTNGTIFLLGDTFIRSAYVVYDVDYLQVSMAPARYNNSYEENIVQCL